MVSKSLMNIFSIYKILLNKFKIKDLSKPLQPNLGVPINNLFKDLILIMKLTLDQLCIDITADLHFLSFK